LHPGRQLRCDWTMILYATDYDGTVSPHTGEELNKTIAEWQAAGNLFVVDTGRPLASIRSTLQRQQFRPDFIIGDNGAAIATPDYELLYTKTMAPQDVVLILDYLKDKIKDGPRLDATFGHFSSRGVPERLEVTPDGNGVVFGDMIFGPIFEICVIFEEKDKNLEINAEIEKLTEGRIVARSSSRVSSDYVAAGVSKADGIFRLVDSTRILPEKIIATGDAYNDIEMLCHPDIEGYVVENGMDPVKEQVGRTIDSPIGLMKKYLEKNI